MSLRVVPFGGNIVVRNVRITNFQIDRFQNAQGRSRLPKRTEAHGITAQLFRSDAMIAHPKPQHLQGVLLTVDIRSAVFVDGIGCFDLFGVLEIGQICPDAANSESIAIKPPAQANAKPLGMKNGAEVKFIGQRNIDFTVSVDGLITCHGRTFCLAVNRDQANYCPKEQHRDSCRADWHETAPHGFKCNAELHSFCAPLQLLGKSANMNSTSHQYELAYQGSLRTTMTHLRSGDQVITDAPVDNEGKGEAFSPTDLVSAALAACVMTIMGIKARDMGHEKIEMNAKVWKEMASNPRRIGTIRVDLDLHIPDVTDQQKVILERTTKACPVARSLHPDTHKRVTFNWH